MTTMKITKKYAILIGINDLPNFPYLETPASYARQMYDWANFQGYKPFLFVDEDEHGTKQPVTTQLLHDTISQILEENPQQLLIYFAGHGVELSAGNDIWLLPGYDQNPNEAINVFQNKQLAYEAGADHVIFISDSCRTPSGSQDLRHINGSAIFPKARKTNYQTEIDILYSTWPGQPSVDFKDDKGEYRSVYTECLLKCLNGQVAEVIKQLERIHPTFPAVVPDELSRYLKIEVPKQMASAGIKQYPMGEVTSRDPIHLAHFPDRSPIDNVEKQEQPYQRPPATIQNRLDYFMGLNIGGQNTDQQRKKIDSLRIRNSYMYELLYVDLFPPPKNSSVSGLMVNGNDNPIFYCPEYLSPVWRNRLESSPFHFKFWQTNLLSKKDYAAVTTVISNESRTRFYPIQLLPGFFCQIDFDNDQLLSTSYYPLSQEYRMQEAYTYRNEVANRKTDIIVAAQKGIFQGTEELADYIRKYKALDPVLGLFAAYAYFQKGIYQDVQSVYSYMRHEQEPVLNDVRLLNYLSDKERSTKMRNLQFPLLTEGWSYLNLLSENPLKDLEIDLTPGLWTAFSKRGIEKLLKRFNYINLK